MTLPVENWISTKERMPEEGQKVFYYFDYVGVNRGSYSDYHCFHGSRGFLTGDVTFWMPDDGRTEYPLPPIDFSKVPSYSSLSELMSYVEREWPGEKWSTRSRKGLKEKFQNCLNYNSEIIPIRYELKVDGKGEYTYALFRRDGKGVKV